MEKVQVNLGERSYNIYIGTGNLEKLGEYLPFEHKTQLFVITNDLVGPLYGNRLVESLQMSRFHALYYQVPDGEEYKSLESCGKTVQLCHQGGP